MNNSLSKIIKDSIEDTFGDRFDYSLIGVKDDSYILITPFLNNENDFIEIGISAGDEDHLVITDFGRAADYVLGRKRAGDSLKFLFGGIKNITEYFGVSFVESEFRLQTDFNKAGKRISIFLKSLQKIYNLDNEAEKEKKKFDRVFEEVYKKNHTKKQNHRDLFKGEIIRFLKERSVEFIEDHSMEGHSGDRKIVDLKITSAPHRLVSILSTKDIKRASELIKISHSDFSDILKKYKRLNACILYNDKYAPDIWNNCLIKETLKILKPHKIQSFAFYNEKGKVNKYLK